MQYMEKIDPSINKMDWGEGEWQHEPDKVQYLDEETGYPCLIVRAEVTGALCGYVGVGHSHPCYQVHYNDVEDKYDTSIHGGLTFSSKCQEQNKEFGICHIVEDGEDDNIWWLGFDCAHAWDYAPVMQSRWIGTNLYKPQRPNDHEYRNIHYVKDQIKHLAIQLKKCEASYG